MEKNIIIWPEIKLIGISVRTNNHDEINWQTGKIMPCVQAYFHQALFDKIPHRKKPGTTLCVYTNYESDYRGNYTYFIGEEINSFDNLPEGLEKLIIPEQKYVKFTNGPAPMPEAVREPWFKIGNMDQKELGGQRAYLADFEVYDERAADHSKIILDIYIGIKT